MSSASAWPETMPLHGLRILDLTHVWSGPMGTRLLNGLGAEVVKVESPRKPDLLRGLGKGLRLRYPDLDPGQDPENRNAWFNTQNTGKQSLTIDVKHPDGLDLVHRLAARSDAVVANYRPGVLERIGLGYAELCGLREDIVLVEMPGYPADSPHAHAPAFGAQFDAHSGATTLTGDDDAPLLTGYALGDPTAGLFAAAATVTALLRRRETGRGAHVVLPQSESMIPLLGEYLLAASRGTPIQEGLNADRRHTPGGVYQTADGWLAVSVADDHQWKALAAYLEDLEPGAADTYATAGQRAAHRAEVEDLVARWAASLDDAAAAAAQLQRDGVPAGPVNDAAALLADPQLAAADYFTTLHHPSAGTHRHPSLPIHVDGHRATPDRAAPTLGADTDRCLTEILDLDETTLADLRERGVTATT